MDYTVVTAWYDVRTKENHALKDKTTDDFFCTTATYFEKAVPFFQKPFPMVIFTEARFRESILAARPIELHDKTLIIVKEYEELNLYDQFPTFEENHHKNRVINLDTQKFTPLYKFLVNQKTNFVREIVETNPFQTTSFAWMDLRLHSTSDVSVEETTEVINNIDLNRVKLMFMCDLPLWHIQGRYDFYSWTRGKVAAGFFAGRREPLLRFADLCQEEFLEAIREHMSPSDEMIYSFVTAHHLDLFDPYVGDYCDCLRNQLKTKNSVYLAMPFFRASVERGNTFFVARLADQLRLGQLENHIGMPLEDRSFVWFHGCVAHFELGHADGHVYLEEYKGFSSDTEIEELEKRVGLYR
jgi:hypothetical protein